MNSYALSKVLNTRNLQSHAAALTKAELENQITGIMNCT